MEYQTQPHPLVPNAVDILMHVGLEYSVPEYILETELYGASKRISMTSIPEGLIPGVSRMFLWHSHAIPIVQAPNLSMVDLAKELIERGLLDTDFDPEDFTWNPADWALLPDDYVPPGTLQVTCAVQRDRKLRSHLEEKYLIKWQGGVICYVPIGKLRYILKKDETDLPEHLQPYRHLIDAVRVVRVDDDGNPLEDQDAQCSLDEIDEA